MSLKPFIEDDAPEKKLKNRPYWAENEGILRLNSYKIGLRGDILDTYVPK